jgi:hypothetical protein
VPGRPRPVFVGRHAARHPPASQRLSPMAFTAIAAVVVLLTAMLIQVGSPVVKRSSAEFSVVVTACSLVGSSPPMAQVTYAVHNEGLGTKDARLRIDYRDASGARIGSDLTRIRSVAAGITVASGKTTVLHSMSRSLRCRIALLG